MDIWLPCFSVSSLAAKRFRQPVFEWSGEQGAKNILALFDQKLLEDRDPLSHLKGDENDMAIVTTIPKKGDSPQAYDIPDADLQKYAHANTQFVEGEDPPAGARNIEEADAIGLAASDDVEAYGVRCYCWYWVGDRYIKRQAPCWWRRCP